MSGNSQQAWLEAFEKEHKTVRELSRIHNVPELEVLKALQSKKEITLLGKSQIKPLLTDLATLGTTVIIVENQGNIFEMKCAFPEGSEGFGYYNLKVEGECGLGGHIDIEHIAYGAVTTEFFFNKESKAQWFIHESGRVIFKVYVGREKDGSFKPLQLALFDKWSAKKI